MLSNLYDWNLVIDLDLDLFLKVIAVKKHFKM